MSTIVVGVDGSTTSRRALHVAAEEARFRGAELVVVMAWEYPAPALIPIGGALPPADAMEDATRDGLKTLLDEEFADDPGVVVVPVVGEGSGATALLFEARDRDADMIVVGRRSRGTLADVFLGSTSRQLVHHAGCPVLVVPEQLDTEADEEAA
jgi:nucleotide-binding universal stress UspA family protein